MYSVTDINTGIIFVMIVRSSNVLLCELKGHRRVVTFCVVNQLRDSLSVCCGCFKVYLLVQDTYNNVYFNKFKTLLL